MGRLWDSQNSWDCLGLESQGQSRDFGIFYKNMIYSSHFFNMNPYCTQNFAKIDLQNWNFYELQRSHVTIYADYFSTNRLNRYAEIGHPEFRRSNVKSVHLRSNLRFRLKNWFKMTHISLTDEKFSSYVIWCDKNIEVLKFYLGLVWVEWGHFYDNRLFQLFFWFLATDSINFL